MPYQISQPIDILSLQQVLDTLEADAHQREQTAVALALQNAELHAELQRLFDLAMDRVPWDYPID